MDCFNFVIHIFNINTGTCSRVVNCCRFLFHCQWFSVGTCERKFDYPDGRPDTTQIITVIMYVPPDRLWERYRPHDTAFNSQLILSLLWVNEQY